MRSMDIRWILDNKVNGCTFAGLDTETKVVLKGGKSNPLQGKVTKRTLNSNVMLFSNKQINGYDAMVKRRLEAEGVDPESFILSPRVWGVRLPNEPVVSHKDKLYLEVIFRKAGHSIYYVDGVQTPKEMIAGLPDKEEGEQGGLENKVIIRTYAFESINRITIDHETFVSRKETETDVGVPAFI